MQQQVEEESTFVYRYTSEAPRDGFACQAHGTASPITTYFEGTGSVCWSFVSCFRVTMSCVRVRVAESRSGSSPNEYRPDPTLYLTLYIVVLCSVHVLLSPVVGPDMVNLV